MSTSPPGAKAPDALPLYPSRYNLKSTLSQGLFQKLGQPSEVDRNAVHGNSVFALREIRHLGLFVDDTVFLGFRSVTRASERWRTLSQEKLAELDGLMDGIQAVRGRLKKMMTKCRCATSDQCGKAMFRSMNRNVPAMPLIANHPHRHK